MKTIHKMFIMFLGAIFVFLLLPTPAFAHCRPWHPHHCVEDAINAAIDVGEFIYGGVKKRAKIIYDDPVGSVLDPIKVIDEGIPSPLSYVEYTIRNPDEVINILKNPPAGVVGMPVAMAISDGRNAALKNGVRPIPQHIRSQIAPYFDAKLLDSVRYSVGSTLFNGLLQGLAFKLGDAEAITLVNVIVFKDQADVNSAPLWSHELTHVRQYHELGLSEFAATYTLNYHAIENPAYQFGGYYAQVKQQNFVTSQMLVGLAGKCMAATGLDLGRPVVLSQCNANSNLQQWRFTLDGEIQTSNGNCLDVQWGKVGNRIPLQVWRCNKTKAQIFKLNSRGEIRSALGKSLCVEVAGGFTQDGTQIQTFECNKTASQEWINPTVKIISAEIKSPDSSSKCLRVDSLSTLSLVRLANCDRGDPQQQWAHTEYNDQIRLIAAPNICLDVQGRIAANGVPLQTTPCDSNTKQRFRITKQREIRSNVGSNICLYVANSDMNSRQPIVIAQCDNSRKQVWN